MKTKILLSICAILMTSCISYQTPTDPTTPQEINGFPQKPALVEYSRKPIIEKKDKDFTVSDEFVENSVLFKKYSDKIDQWKVDNNVK